jgi:hypothetical protein
MAGVIDASSSVPAMDTTGGPEDDLRILTSQRARDATLSLAREAEREAAEATRERDAVDTCIRAALACAAQARAAAGPLPDDGGAVNSTQSDPDGARDAFIVHEAAVLLQLHAQAVAVQNIRALVPVVFDITSPFYTRWRDYFLLVVGRYTLTDHVLIDTFVPSSPDWMQMDCVVKSWIVDTITTELADAVLICDVPARGAWLAIESQFLGNRETWALFLDAEFRNFRQGDLSIIDYCRKFKGMADALSDLGEPVPDRTLVLNVIRGLNERFASIGLHLRRGRSLPTFLEVRNDLLLEELTFAHHSIVLTSVLLATTTDKPPTNKPEPPPPHHPPSNPKCGTRGGKKGGRRSGPPTKQHGPGSTSTNTWPSFYNPWSGSIQMWPGPRMPTAPSAPHQQSATPLPQSLIAGIQGPWPGAPQQPWSTPSPPGFPTTTTPSWDQQALLSSFSTMTLQPPRQNEWFFDSGATTHMSSDAGTPIYFLHIIPFFNYCR